MGNTVSNYGPYDVQSFKAGADLDAATNHFGKIDANGDVVLCGDGEHADGVIVNVQAAGVGATIGLMTSAGKKVPVAVNSAVTAGASLGSGASGRGNTAVTSDVINGIALNAAGADGELVTCLFGFRGTQA